MPNLLLERYLNGEHREVWRDLLSLGAAVRLDRYYPDAKAVAEETMKRARHNTEHIIHKLDGLGYRFGSLGEIEREEEAVPNATALASANLPPAVKNLWMDRLEMMKQMQTRLASTPSRNLAALAQLHQPPPLENPKVFQPSTAQTRTELDEFEAQLKGPLPISLRAWYEQVSAVSLTGRHELLSPPFARCAPDPLVIEPFREVADCEINEDGEFDEDFHLWLAPDDLHKANTSGGDAYSMKLPDPSADGPLIFEWHNTTFVNYLRIVFEWGGFPGWQRSANRPQKELDYLKEDLLSV